VDCRRLTTFVQVAELGSLSRAADRLRIAQPALSRQMRLLENEIGLPLFERHRRGMQLTEAGEDLRARVVGPLRQIDRAVEEVRSLAHEVGGNIAFGMTPTTSYVLAGPLARRVVEQAANVSLRVVEGYGGHLVDWLQRGEIDLALLYGPAADYQLKAEELLVESVVLVGGVNCSLHPDKPVTVSELAQLPLVLPSHPNGLRVIVDNAAARARAKLNVRFQADSFLLMMELVESGLGYTMLPLSAISREVAAARLRYAPISKPRITRQLILATLPGNSPSRAALKLGTLVRQEIVAQVRSGRWQAHLLFDPAPYEDSSS
jgi:LysR family transcriptional regulator, nitrogen assimilation regulatory protein